jgi:hypothetical protein
VYDPTDAVGRLLFNVLAMVAEFESDLIRLRTVEAWRPRLASLVRHQSAELPLAPAVPDLTPHRDAGAWRLRLHRSQPMEVLAADS